MRLLLLSVVAVIAALVFGGADALSVTFDGRALRLDGEPLLALAGSVHYPRAPRNEWAGILSAARAQGLNVLQTYVFWGLHEPARDVWHFPSDPSSNEDLVAFVMEAQKAGFLVHLRIAGYICAEWNFGGMPVWLRGLNSTLRTLDDTWLLELSQFVEKTISVVSEAGLLARDGGPIVLMQMENEYGNMEEFYGANGKKYVQWLSDYARSLDIGGIPWVMCQQGEGTGTAPDASIINTCNGFYCDSWIAKHAADFPNQPHMWTENWPGWFQNWGQPVPHRPTVDVAFAVARWFAYGGTYMNYYMAYGGTTFDRSVGGPLIVTSYDYDVQINEYGMRAEPKYSLLAQLHSVLQNAAPALLGQFPPAVVPLARGRDEMHGGGGGGGGSSSSCESHTYDQVPGICVAFLSNFGEGSACEFPLSDGVTTVVVPAWSVSIVGGSNCTEELFNTKKSILTSAHANRKHTTPSKHVHFTEFASTTEPVPSVGAAAVGVPVVESAWPLEQLTVTGDSTDYLWYSTVVPVGVVPTSAATAQLSFSTGTAGGKVMFVYVNGERVADTLNENGGPPTVAKLSVDVLSKRQPFSQPVTVTDDAPVSLTIPVPASSFTLDILSVSMGLQNYGPYLEKIEVGITSNVTINGVVLAGGFKHSVGLVGEMQLAAAESEAAEMTEGTSGLTWHRGVFSIAADKDTSNDARHLAIDLSTSTLGKGAIWVNDCMLGRYWNVTAVATVAQRSCADDCSSATYTGAFNGDRCRTGCGEPSQRLYKLPSNCVVFSSSGESESEGESAATNKIVILDELGGSPAGLQIVDVTMVVDV